MNAWYYSDAQRNRMGPVAADDLAELHANGQLAPEILVWREGLPDWKPWREVMAEVLGTAPSPRGPIAPAFAVASGDAPAGASGNPYEIVERAPATPYAAPRAAVIQPHDFHAGGTVVYAGFWKRFAAYFIDSLVIGIAGFIVQMVLFGVFFGGMAAFSGNPSGLFSSGLGIAGLVAVYVIPLTIYASYFAAMHASARQATLGKMAVGIKVTDEAGHPISFARGFGRYFAQLLSSIILMVGFIMAGFTDRKRALHDMICGTLVVDAWAFTSHPERQRTELGTVTVVIISIAALFVVGYIVLIGFAVALGMAAGSH